MVIPTAPSIRHPVIAEDIASILSRPEDWRSFAGKHVLIAGATSFLAAYLVEFFAELSERWPEDPVTIYVLVRSLDKLKKRFPHLLGQPWFCPIVQDVCDPPPVIKRVDFIVHAASAGSPKQYLNDPVGTIKSNVVGGLNLLELARKHNARLLFMSSGAVYGHGESLSPIGESDFGVLDPLDISACYGEGKRATETLCAEYYRQYGVATVIARISHTYGPGLDLDDGRSFADFVADAVAGRDIILNSDGSASRPFCYVADATAAFLILLLRGESGAAYNVSLDQEITILELALLVARLSPTPGLKVKHPPSAPARQSLFRSCGHCDISKLEKLGWRPTIMPAEGFERTLRYFIDN
ncbi:NAD-dependent epimerase/dehydratase family protein [Halopseudomonas pachastrellae]|uniref:NAD-dependent epimerase/dehydratase family protein n=1 Tax=Pseudomonas sp. TaxID=306 RepID=UPI002CB686D0|nr:NAD-dependent epimerase/dehydratase family protein [Halopseudomonas pachastrellae]|tara:strand:- start:4519 stop:5583 length:1065 start_codon:yes stop_codon:yes gene_type:complete